MDSPIANQNSATTLAEPLRYRIAARVGALNDWLLHDVPIGPKALRPRQVINLTKVAIGPFTLLLMFLQEHWSTAAWLYLALHGLYGQMWLVKDIAYGDPSWRRECTVGSALVIGVYPLGCYFLPPILMMTSLGDTIPGRFGRPETMSNELAFGAVCAYVVGCFFHFVSDAQKHYVLEHKRPRGLITNGMFALTRNPNYFGEVLIYCSFNLLAQHWLPWAVCALVWLQLFLVNMLRKDASMSRYPEHAAWVKRTGLFFPSPIGLAKKLVSAFQQPPE